MLFRLKLNLKIICGFRNEFRKQNKGKQKKDLELVFFWSKKKCLLLLFPQIFQTKSGME